MQGSFTSQDIIRLTGITARQLQWWDERRIVVPARQGHRRVYSFEDLVALRVVARLLDAGVSLQGVRRVLADEGLLVVSVPHANYPFWWDPANKVLETWFGKHVPSDIWWAAGIWADEAEIASKWAPSRVVEPARKPDRARWKEAVERAKATVPELSTLDF